MKNNEDGTKIYTPKSHKKVFSAEINNAKIKIYKKSLSLKNERD